MNDSLVSNFNKRLIAEWSGTDPQPSWCQSKELFKEIWDAFRDAPVKFRLRNFNNLSSIKTAILTIPGIAKGDWVAGEGNRVYCHNLNLFELTGRDEVREILGTNESATIETLIEAGPKFAALLGREVSILHQLGSGNQDEASYEDYGPWPAKPLKAA